MSNLARWIRATRGTTTQREFSAMLDVPIRTLQSWEAGMSPRHPEVLRLAIERIRELYPEGEES